MGAKNREAYRMTDFYKYHALGNDYIVMDPNKIGINLSCENITQICHRHFGVGSDGILYGPVMVNDKMGLRIYNPDGSEAEKSGNGIRIFSKYLVDAGYTTEKSFDLSTLGGIVHVKILNEDASLIKVDMGVPTFISNQIPVLGDNREVVNEELAIDSKPYKITCVSIGNPHCVIPLDSISKKKVMEIGRLVENHPIFPKRINLQIVQVLDKNNIQIEIWERGAGYTMASGSSSCAAACAACKLGLVENQVKVHMPGGVIDIEIQQDGHVYMTGAVSGVAQGEFLEEMREHLMK
jgi:diaminopimelate epimerase